MYVDDGFVVDSFSDAADAELEALHRAFTVAIKPAQFFLGTNIVVHEPAPMRKARQKSVELAAAAP